MPQCARGHLAACTASQPTWSQGGCLTALPSASRRDSSDPPQCYEGEGLTGEAGVAAAVNSWL